MQKVQIIRIDAIQLTDGTLVRTGAGLAAAVTARKVDNGDFVVRVRVDNELDKNAQVIVPPSHVAFLIKDGKILETLNGGKYDVYDKKRDLSGVFIKRFKTDAVDVVYLSVSVRVPMSWGTPSLIEMRDPVADLPVKLGANGEFEVQISNPQKFYHALVGLEDQYGVDKLTERLRARLVSAFKPVLAKIMTERKLTYYHMDENAKEIGAAMLPIFSALFENDYGIKMFSFFIGGFAISDADKAKVEAVIQQEKAEQKAKAQKAESRAELKETLADLERLSDKAWEKEKYLLELKGRDYARYLEVCEAIGWDAKTGAAASAGARFCSECGSPYKPSDRFCNGCGAPVGDAKKAKAVCPDCKKENEPGSKFCSGCGNKL